MPAVGPLGDPIIQTGIMTQQITQQVVGQCHQRDEHQQHGGYVEEEFQTRLGTVGNGLQHIAPLLLELQRMFYDRFGLRTDHLGYHNGSGNCHHRGGQQVFGKQYL